LEGANLSNTSLNKVIFDRANLSNLDFAESNLDTEKSEEIKGITLCGVIFADGSTSDREYDWKNLMNRNI